MEETTIIEFSFAGYLEFVGPLSALSKIDKSTSEWLSESHFKCVYQDGSLCGHELPNDSVSPIDRNDIKELSKAALCPEHRQHAEELYRQWCPEWKASLTPKRNLRSSRENTPKSTNSKAKDRQGEAHLTSLETKAESASRGPPATRIPNPQPNFPNDSGQSPFDIPDFTSQILITTAIATTAPNNVPETITTDSKLSSDKGDDPEIECRPTVITEKNIEGSHHETEANTGRKGNVLFPSDKTPVWPAGQITPDPTPHANDARFRFLQDAPTPQYRVAELTTADDESLEDEFTALSMEDLNPRSQKSGSSLKGKPKQTRAKPKPPSEGAAPNSESKRKSKKRPATPRRRSSPREADLSLRNVINKPAFDIPNAGNLVYIYRISPSKVESESTCRPSSLSRPNPGLEAERVESEERSDQDSADGAVEQQEHNIDQDDILNKLKGGLCFKVGWTNNVESRLNKLQKCGFNLELAWFSKDLAKWEAQKLETLIHAELAHFNRRFHCKSCSAEHREWFEVPFEHVKNAAERWEAFIKHKPYDANSGRLISYWTTRTQGTRLYDLSEEEHDERHQRWLGVIRPIGTVEQIKLLFWANRDRISQYLLWVSTFSSMGLPIHLLFSKNTSVFVKCQSVLSMSVLCYVMHNNPFTRPH
jgi:T5orf172 domain-containing protein